MKNLKAACHHPNNFLFRYKFLLPKLILLIRPQVMLTSSWSRTTSKSLPLWNPAWTRRVGWLYRYPGEPSPSRWSCPWGCTTATVSRTGPKSHWTTLMPSTLVSSMPVQCGWHQCAWCHQSHLVSIPPCVRGWLLKNLLLLYSLP